MLVYDITNDESFENIENWMSEIIEASEFMLSMISEKIVVKKLYF